jgi:N-acetylglutamate synthase-like GNAT family acetyltransferase
LIADSPQPVSLRPAAADEQDIIKKMVRDAHLNPMGLKWQRFTVAVDGQDCVVGCIQHKPHKGEVVELGSLVVHKGWRKQGVARLLIDHLKESAGPPLWLMCRSGLTSFYEPFGFRRVYLGQPMPGSFRWLLRATFLLNRLAPPNQQLAIMVWEK